MKYAPRTRYFVWRISSLLGESSHILRKLQLFLRLLSKVISNKMWRFRQILEAFLEYTKFNKKCNMDWLSISNHSNWEVLCLHTAILWNTVAFTLLTSGLKSQFFFTYYYFYLYLLHGWKSTATLWTRFDSSIVRHYSGRKISRKFLPNSAYILFCWRNAQNHGLRTSNNSPFFIKVPNFWGWADNFGKYIFEHLGYFQPIYQQHPFWYCESFVIVFH